MANIERQIPVEFSLRRPDRDEIKRIVTNQSHQPTSIQAEWHDRTGGVVATATIVPSRYKDDPNQLRAFSEAFTGADMIRIQEVLSS